MNTDFQAIQEYFCAKHCAGCGYRYTPQAITLINQAAGCVAARIVCTGCRKPLGVAIATKGQVVGAKEKPLPYSKADAIRLGDKPPITYDDVLDAHNFFDSLGADWAKMLPRVE